MFNQRLFMDTRSLPDHQAASLADVSQDVLLLVGEACSDPLAPMALAHLAATSCQILTVLRPKLNELRDFRAELRALCSKAGTHVSSLAEVEELAWVECSLALAEITVLGRLLRSVALPRLGSLGLNSSQIDNQGCTALVQGLGKGSLPSLQTLWLGVNQIGDEGMKAFSGALSSGSLASLKELYLHRNQIGDEGMKAFSSALSSGALDTLKVKETYLNHAHTSLFPQTYFSPQHKQPTLSPYRCTGPLCQQQPVHFDWQDRDRERGPRSINQVRCVIKKRTRTRRRITSAM